VQLVVDDRCRHEVDLALHAGLVGADHIVEEAVARRAELARAGAPTLDVPLEVEPLAQEIADVLAQHGLVDRGVAEAAPDEDEPRATGDRPDRPDGHVDATEDVVRREAVPCERVSQHHRVQVGAVTGQEYQRVLAPKLPHALEAGVVDVEGVGA
jgi:hypothetical protein